uniref:Uncharacterized protein MANES_03G144300 n=1 Tax=Rhizophora mucronata TaxID=61149 RepID=A0A2P2N192_RHIMU
MNDVHDMTKIRIPTYLHNCSLPGQNTFSESGLPLDIKSYTNLTHFSFSGINTL